MRHVRIPEEKVAGLKSEAEVRQHYADELRINELQELAHELSTLDRAPKARRDAFRAHRGEILDHGQAIAARSEESFSPLLRKPFLQARRAWAEAISALGAARQ